LLGEIQAIQSESLQMGVLCKGTNVYRVDHANYAWFENDFIQSSASLDLYANDNGQWTFSCKQNFAET